ncbi:MAG: RNA polymerase sigma factor [Alicyclobacillaceae bacterium]|nr:RNA polymerase sigma factor [Alicyclobacillaceae bacterium]
MLSDEELARAVARGDAGALEALVYRYHGPLFGYLQRVLRQEWAAEDLVQETFLRFVRQLQTGAVPDRVRPWLYRVATNLCRDYWRSADRRCDRELPADWADREDFRPSVVEICERQETRREIVQALEGLPEIQRRMVVLRFYQDLTYREIAEVLEVPVGTVKAYLYQAMRSLRSALGELEETRSRAGGKHYA